MPDSQDGDCGRTRENDSAQDAELRFRLLSDSLRDAFVRVAMDGHIVECNALYCQLLGYSSEELDDLTYRDLTPERWHALEEAIVVEQVLPRGHSEVYEKEYQRKDGTLVPVELRTVLERDAAGRPIAMWAIVRDIGERKRTEAALRESEARYRTLFESIDEGFCTIEVLFDEQGHTTDYRFLEANPAFLRQTGLDNVVGRTARELLPQLEPFWFERYGHIARTGHALRFDHEPPGLGTYYDVHAFRFGAPEEHRVAILFSDITERKTAEAALRESEERFRMSFANAAIGFAMNGLDYRYLDVNAAYCAMTGYTREELLAAQGSELIHPDDWPANRALAQRLLAGEIPGFVIENRYVRKDGERIWVRKSVSLISSADGAPRWLVTLVEDVTERRQAEEALRQSESRFRQVAESLPQLVWTCAAEGQCDWLSPQWVRYTGKSEAEQLGYGWLEQLHPEDRARTSERWQATATAGLDFEIEFRIRRHDGAYRWFRTLAVPLRDAAGQIVKWFGSNTDIDDLKQADRRTSDFLAMLGHELRNPLAPIRNSLYVLERVAPGGELARQAQATIDRQVAHLARLVDDLLEVTRISRGKIELQRERLDLRELVRRTVEDYRDAFAQNRLGLELVLPQEALWASADRTRIAQIVGNLLGNAAKFTPAGGRVTVLLERDPHRDQAVLRVRDTGIGIAPETLTRLFEPFAQDNTTLDRSRGGLGLGLATVKGLVELHGGSASVASAGSGLGAELTVRLPLDLGEPEADPPQAHPARGTTRRRVLIVEDNVDAAESLRLLLDLCGHTVAVAHSGPVGIETARRFGPEVILCDIGLPGMDGYTVARTLRNGDDPRLRATRLVALSGYAAPEDIARAREAGFDDHCAKPLSLGQLTAILGSARGGENPD